MNDYTSYAEKPILITGLPENKREETIEMDYLCPKRIFTQFSQKQGWLVLFDKVMPDGYEIGLLTTAGETILATFNNAAQLISVNDISGTLLTINEED